MDIDVPWPEGTVRDYQWLKRANEVRRIVEHTM